MVTLALAGCNGAKYACAFDQGSSLDFSKGKWILNKPFEEGINARMYGLAIKHFGVILGDSLMEMHNVRSEGLIASQSPFEPTKEELEDIRIGTQCDYLINIKGTVLKEEMSGFAGSTTYGSAERSNTAKVDIRIYDLNNFELVSSSFAIGKDKRTLTEDHDWSLVTGTKTIRLKGLSKLIRKYKKNQLKTLSKK